MSTKGFIRLETAEGGIEYWDGSTKIAFINESGTVQATRGNAERKDELLPWIGENYPGDLPEGEASKEMDRQVTQIFDGDWVEVASSDLGSAPESAPETGAVSETDSAQKEENLNAHQLIAKKRAELSAKGTDIPPVCPLTGSSTEGSKSPEVVAWWFDNHPEQARVKYANHKHLWPQ